MPTIDPRLLLILCLLFIGLAVFNLYLGIKRLREAHARGEKLRWYKQMSILTGVEYALLALAFVGSISISNGWLPGSIRPIILPINIVMLIFTAVLAGIVVYQNSKNAKRIRIQGSGVGASAPSIPVSAPVEVRDQTEEEQTLVLQRRRERRQKAAAARRRRAGRA